MSSRNREYTLHKNLSKTNFVRNKTLTRDQKPICSLILTIYIHNYIGGAKFKRYPKYTIRNNL